MKLGDRAGELSAGWAVAAGGAVALAALARGGWDLWAATAAAAALLGLAAAMGLALAWPEDGPGFLTEPLPWLGAAAAVAALSFGASCRPSESFQRCLDLLAAGALFWTALHAFGPGRGVELLPRLMVPLFWLELCLILHQRYEYMWSPAGFAAGRRSSLFSFFLAKQVPGTLVNPNAAAMFFLAWLAPMAAAVRSEWRASGRVPAYLASGLAAAALCLLLVNSAWAAVCVLVLAPLWPGPAAARAWAGRNRSRAAAVAAAVLLGLAAVAAVKLGTSRDTTGNPIPLTSRLARVAWWASGWYMFRDHPLLGVGPGGYGSAYLAYKAGPVQNTLYAHSAPVTLAAELGLAGLACFGAFLLWACRKLTRGGALEDRWPYALGLAAMALYGLVGLSVELLANLLLAALFAGVILAPAMRKQAKPGRAVLVVLAAALAACVPFLAAPFMASRICVEAGARLAAGNARGAARGFAAAAGLDRFSDEARRGWARASWVLHVQTGDPKALEEAVIRQREAAALARLSGVMWGELGEYVAAQGDRRGAVALLEKAVRLNAPNPRFQLVLGYLRAAGGPPARRPPDLGEPARRLAPAAGKPPPRRRDAVAPQERR